MVTVGECLGDAPANWYATSRGGTTPPPTGGNTSPDETCGGANGYSRFFLNLFFQQKTDILSQLALPESAAVNTATAELPPTTVELAAIQPLEHAQVVPPLLHQPVEVLLLTILVVVLMAILVRMVTAVLNMGIVVTLPNIAQQAASPPLVSVRKGYWERLRSFTVVKHSTLGNFTRDKGRMVLKTPLGFVFNLYCTYFQTL